jgi:hypothetical protein
MRKRNVLPLLGLLCFSAAVTWAQVTTGTISGTVRDSSGAVLPGTQIVILNEGTSISRTVETDTTGRYTVPLLSLGNYRVTATHEGFRTEVRSGIVLTVGEEAIVDLSLIVGGVTQSVEVSGEPPLVESTTASMGFLVDDRTIRALPLNGRSYDQLALLQPGVVLTSPGQTGGTPYAFGTGKRFTVGGQRSVSNSFLLDGTNVNDQANGTPGGAAGVNLGVDTILEFKIFTNDFKAEFGHSSGSVITAVTRSGTNDFHGTIFEYIRNSVLDARNFFDTGSSPPPFRRNQFGGVLGGPIKKDKTFFFAGYEGLRQALANTLTEVVPDAQARQGILPTGKVMVNPAVVPYLNLYPLPNGPELAGGGVAKFTFAPSAPTNADNVMGRVDHQLNAKTAIFARYTFDADSVNAPLPSPDVTLDEATTRQYVTLQANSVLSSRVLNSFRFAFNRTHSDYNTVIGPSVPPELSIIPGLPLGYLALGSFGLTTNLPITPLGSPNGTGPRLWAFNVFEWGDDFSYITGKHSLKTGVDIQRIQDNTASGQIQRGQYTFASLQTFLTGTPSTLLAGAPLGVLPQWGLRQSLFAVYGQDDYAVNSRLTLNLGLRWEITTDPKDAKGQASILPSLSAPAMVPSDTYFRISKKNFEPRVGLAWKLNDSGKTILRAAAGIYHNQILPYVYALNIGNPPAYGRFTATNPPFPNGYTVLKPGALLAITPFTPTVKTPVDDQWNLSIQQQVFSNTVLQVAYVGNHANHLETEREGNTTIPTFINGNPATPFYPANTPRQNPHFLGISQLEMNGNSSYNAVTVSLRRQSASGFQGQIAYTYSKALDDTSGVSGSDSVRNSQAVMNPYDIGEDYGLADFDVRHVLLGNFTYQLPFRNGSKVLGAVVNGWALDGILTVETGMPFSARLTTSVSRDQAQFLAERPSLKPGANPNPTSGVSAGCSGFPAGTRVGNPTHWYNPCAFTPAPAGTYGNLRRNTIIGPGLRDVDFALEKNFRIQEKATATFRFEVFNVLNHANFGLPNTSAMSGAGVANSSAGLITYTLTSSRQLQFGLRISF